MNNAVHYTMRKYYNGIIHYSLFAFTDIVHLTRIKAILLITERDQVPVQALRVD